MKKLLLIFAIILTAISANAQQQIKEGKTKYDQLQTNDIVTISRESGGNRTYFTVENNAIAAHNEPNVNSLWRIVYCAYQKFDWGDQNIYQFQHVNSGKYLRVDASGSGNRVTIRFSASDNNEAYSTICQNNPGNQINGAEQGRLHYYYENRDFYIVVNNNAWVFETGTNQNLFVEKWIATTSTSFETYFSPETYDFGLVKYQERDAEGNVTNTNEVGEIVANKTIRFVMDMRTTTSYQCAREKNRKQIDFASVVESDMEKLKEQGIIPTFKWQSSQGNTSTLTFSDNGYSTTTTNPETSRQMMGINQDGVRLSDDKLAYEIPIQAFGKSPLNLQHKHNAGVVTWANYVDYLVATWNDGKNTATARVVRKSYHTEDLPPFEYSTSPSTFTFEGQDNNTTPANELVQTFKINGIHQHGTAYYDVDGRIADKDYEYGPVPMPIKEDEGKLSYTFNFVEATNNNTIGWLTHNYGGASHTDTTGITVTADLNNTAYRQGRLHGVVTLTATRGGQEHTHSEDIYIPINQRVVNGQNIRFNHQEGQGDTKFDKNNRQQVHTAERTIYYTSGQREIKLQLAESNFFGYMRWYDYDSNGDGGDPTWNNDVNKRTTWATAPRGANGTNFKAINTSYGNSRGLYGINNDPLTSNSENNPAPILKGWNYGTYTPAAPTADQKTKAIHTIACDVSAYTDYTIDKNGNRVTSITEPTLSYRQLFHLRPAEEMAKQLNDKSHLNPAEYLENYKYRAAVGADVHLATKYRYKSYTGSHESELCYFYYNKKNELKRIGKDVQAKWFIVDKDGNETEVKNPEYQVYDYLNIDSDKAETVVYVLKVPANDTGNSDDTRLKYDLLIARFEVKFVNINECGPRKDAIISDHEINEHFISLKKIDFSFGNDAPGTDNVKQLDYHLPWDQSTYGYYYPNTYQKNGTYIGATNSNHNDQNIPYYGEYFLVNKMDKDWARAEQHGGAKNGYALYVDGTTEPGVVVSISTDAVICAGQTLYCSAWLCNPCPTSFDYNSPRNPIFRCNVEGRMKDYEGNYGEWEDISIFFVGQLPKQSGWQQIVFPVESEKSYDETRVSIYNFATGGSGNDFMVDDICLFASPLHLTGYQAQTNCASDANTESSTAVILRIDYSEFQGQRDQYMYYQIYNESKKDAPNQMDAIVKLQTTLGDKESAYYHDNPSNTLDTLFGFISIPRNNFNPIAYNDSIKNLSRTDTVKIYNSVQEFKDVLVDRIQERLNDGDDTNNEKSEKGKAYIQTTGGKWLLYVMHIVPNASKNSEGIVIDTDENKYLFEYYNYTLRMANVPEELSAAECNMQTPLHATQATVFDLYNGCGDIKGYSFIPSISEQCPNNLYTLQPMVENILATNQGAQLDSIRGNVMADWLVGFDFDDPYANTADRSESHKVAIAAAREAFKDKYGYYRERIKTALIYDLRRQDPNNKNVDKTSFEELDMNSFLDRDNYYIIKDLYEKGLLQLGKRTSTFYLASQDTVRYWIYPIDGTAKGTIGGTEITLHDCIEPIWVMVSSAATDKVLNISPLTNAQKEDTTVLADHPTIKSQLPTVRIRKSQLTSTIAIPIAEVTGVGDLTAEGNFNIDLDKASVKFFDYENNTVLNPQPNLGNLEVGRKYTLRVPFTGDAECQDGCQDMLYLHLLILPDAVVWKPAAGSYNGWGLDENWKGWEDKNGDGIVDNNELLEVGFVPVAGSNVIIPTPTDPTLCPYVHDHNHYPLDINAHPSTCGNIYFAPGAYIHNQHLLKYDNAYVDMQVTAGAWNMVSAPMKNMVSGDMYIPHEGWWDGENPNRETSKPFEINGFQGTRHTDAAYVFWQGFYNTTVDMRYEGNTNLKKASSAEFVYSNALNQPLQVGSGYQLYGLGPGNNGNTGELTIRLPKPDEKYYYYTPEGYKSEKFDAVPTENRNKLAYDGTMEITLENKVANSSSFLFGNPTMAYIDMSAFLADNATVLNPVFHRVENNTWKSATEMTLQADRYLAPMTSVMLETADQTAQSAITVILKPEHLTLNNQIYTIEEQSNELENAPRPLISSSPNSPVASEIMTICSSTGYGYARTILATNPMANDYYQIGEDALFISTGVESESAVVTPLNMYTVAEQVPMMADVRQGISEIPLAILASDNARADYMQLAFYFTPNWSRTCHFYDSQTGQKIRIMDGLVITVEMPQNHEQRYYIGGPDEYLGSSEDNQGPTTAVDNTSSSALATLQAFSLAQGELTIGSNQLIQEIRLYDLAGRLILESPLTLLHTTTTVTAPSGICLVEAVLRDGTTLHTQALVK